MARSIPRSDCPSRSHPTFRGRPESRPDMIRCYEDQDLPVLDWAVLEELEEELPQGGLVRLFAADYVGMWEHRMGCLSAAMEDQDRDAVLDAAISLKVSSAMIGGLRLARLAETLEHSVRKGLPHDGETLLALITRTGVATVKEIQRRYARTNE